MEILQPICYDNQILVYNKSKTVGFALFIDKSDENGIKSRVDLMIHSVHRLSPSNELPNLTFATPFDDKDIDFNINLANFSPTKTLTIYLTFGKQYEFYLCPRTVCAIRTFEQNRHHLRFLAPNSPMGQSVIDLVSNTEPNSRKRARIMCSQIKIGLVVEKESVNQLMPQTINCGPNIELFGPVISVFVKKLSGKTITINIGLFNTILDLKHLFQKRDGIPIDSERVLYCGKQLDNYKTIIYYGITNGSTLGISWQLRGGQEERVNPTAEVFKHLSQPFILKYKKPNLLIGKRGVIGFGHKTHEEFKWTYENPDHHYYIQSFCIDFRLKNSNI